MNIIQQTIAASPAAQIKNFPFTVLSLAAFASLYFLAPEAVFWLSFISFVPFLLFPYRKRNKVAIGALFFALIPFSISVTLWYGMLAVWGATDSVFVNFFPFIAMPFVSFASLLFVKPNDKQFLNDAKISIGWLSAVFASTSLIMGLLFFPSVSVNHLPDLFRLSPLSTNQKDIYKFLASLIWFPFLLTGIICKPLIDHKLSRN